MKSTKAYWLTSVIIVLGFRLQAREVPSIERIPNINTEKILSPDACLKPHVLYVNVGKALDVELFRESVASVTSAQRVPLVITNVASIAGISFFDSEATHVKINQNTKLVIYVINTPSGVSFLSVPKVCGVVNLYGYNRALEDKDPECYRKRLIKLMMKALGLGCGVVGTADSGRCVLAADSYCVSGIDSTSMTYSPFASIPLQDVLGLLIGDENMK